MERVAFLLEASGERVGCLLNPASLVVRRQAGLKPARSIGGPVSGGGLAEDPLLFVGGGCTELVLELLFDVSIGGSTIRATDVRELTRPLCQLAERSELVDGRLRAPRVRFVWGKAWDVPGVVAAFAERLEHFTAGGVPRRSWLSLRLVRSDEPTTPGAVTSTPFISEANGPSSPVVHEVIGGGRSPDGSERGGSQRLDELAQRYYGDASLWRLIARENDLDDPFGLKGGAVLRIPPRGE
jgi:hypothetical protein